MYKTYGDEKSITVSFAIPRNGFIFKPTTFKFIETLVASPDKAGFLWLVREKKLGSEVVVVRQDALPSNKKPFVILSINVTVSDTGLEKCESVAQALICFLRILYNSAEDELSESWTRMMKVMKEEESDEAKSYNRMLNKLLFRQHGYGEEVEDYEHDEMLFVLEQMDPMKNRFFNLIIHNPDFAPDTTSCYCRQSEVPFSDFSIP